MGAYKTVKELELWCHRAGLDKIFSLLGWTTVRMAQGIHLKESPPEGRAKN